MDEGVFLQTAAGETPDVRLGLYSNSEMNMTFPPVYVDRPAWVIRFDDVPAEPNPGSLGTAGVTAHLPANARVNILIFIDADSGRYLNAVQDAVGVG